MKARIKSTGEWVELTETVAYKEPETMECKETINGRIIPIHDLEFEQPIDWDQRRYEIAKAAMRQERLQDISDEDCLKEGIEKWLSVNKYVYKDIKRERMIIFNTPREAYAVLIDRLNGKGTWASNPIVWVYDFELLD